MIYEINLGYNAHERKEITADSKEDADRIARAMADQFIEKIREAVPVTPTVRISNRNFLLDHRAIYLVKRYNSRIPAKCSSSYNVYGRRRFRHMFEYLDQRGGCVLYGENPERLLGKLCDNGRINEKRCKNCVARFGCYTKRA